MIIIIFIEINHDSRDNPILKIYFYDPSQHVMYKMDVTSKDRQIAGSYPFWELILACHSVTHWSEPWQFSKSVLVMLHCPSKSSIRSSSPRNSTNFIHVHFHFPSGYLLWARLACERCVRLAAVHGAQSYSRQLRLNLVSGSVLKTNLS